MHVPSSSLAPSTSQLSEVDSKEFFLFTWKCTLMLGLGLDGYMGDVSVLSPLPLRATKSYTYIQTYKYKYIILLIHTYIHI